MSEGVPDRTSVELEVTVKVPLEYAFHVFTQRFDEIKPHEHNLLPVPIERTVLEPWAGGTVRDVGVDGSSLVWARVLVFEPPYRLVLSWDISPTWQIEKDPARTSEVEIRFLAEGPARTRVVLEHRHLDRHGEGWEGFAALGAAGSWPLYLQRYRAITMQNPGAEASQDPAGLAPGSERRQ